MQKHLVPLGVSLPTGPANETSTDAVRNGSTIGACANGKGAIAGGYFLWLRFPPGLRASDLAKKAQEEENLIIASGSLFKVVREGPGDGNGDGGGEKEPEDFEGFVRLCFAWEEEEKFDEGAARLARLIRREMHRADS